MFSVQLPYHTDPGNDPEEEELRKGGGNRREDRAERVDHETEPEDLPAPVPVGEQPKGQSLHSGGAGW